MTVPHTYDHCNIPSVTGSKFGYLACIYNGLLHLRSYDLPSQLQRRKVNGKSQSCLTKKRLIKLDTTPLTALGLAMEIFVLVVVGR